jgi:hypothetical protein
MNDLGQRFGPSPFAFDGLVVEGWIFTQSIGRLWNPFPERVGLTRSYR